MKKRIPTAIVLVLVIAPLLLFDILYIPAEVIFSLLAIIGSYELFKLTSFKNKNARFLLPSLFTVGNVLAISNSFIKGPNIETKEIWHLLFLVPLLTIIIAKIITFQMKGNDKRNYFLAMIYPGIGFGAMLLLRNFGVKYILFIVLIVALTDTFALFSGMLFGRKKLAPRISPNKTWEGAVGGTIISTVITMPIFYLYNKIMFTNKLELLFNYDGGNIFKILNNINRSNTFLQLLILFIIIILISIVGQIGDLYASAIKRRNGVKDFGNIFPGHGGVLDRFDSLIFASVAFSFILLLGQIG